MPTFWQRWGTTAKSVLDTAVTNVGHSSKKCRIKSDFIDRVIATSRCHFTSFSSFLNDFSFSRFFLCLRLCCCAAVAYSVADRWSTELSGVTLKLSPNYVQVIYFKKLEAIRLIFFSLHMLCGEKVWIHNNIFVFVTASTLGINTYFDSISERTVHICPSKIAIKVKIQFSFLSNIESTTECTF